MADDDLRVLERAASSGDRTARWKWRTGLVRAGRAKEAGLEVGDVIRVDEKGGTRYSLHPWTATVTKVISEKELRVKPLEGHDQWKETYRKDARYLECAAVLECDEITLLEAARP